MCQAVEEYAKECGKLNRMEGRILTYADMGFSVEEISDKMNLSVDEVQEVLDDATL